MTIADEEVKVASWAAKNLVLLIGVGVALLVVGFVIYKVFFAGQIAQNAIATANGQNAVSTAGAASAHDAIQTVSNNGEHAAAVHDTVRIDHETIIREPGAAVAVSDELDAAGRNAICLHDSAAGLPDCQRLREPRP